MKAHMCLKGEVDQEGVCQQRLICWQVASARSSIHMTESTGRDRSRPLVPCREVVSRNQNERSGCFRVDTGIWARTGHDRSRPVRKSVVWTRPWFNWEAVYFSWCSGNTSWDWFLLIVLLKPCFCRYVFPVFFFLFFRIFSHFYVWSMFLMRRLLLNLVLRFLPWQLYYISDKSFLMLCNHLRIGFPLLIFSGTSITITLLPTYYVSWRNNSDHSVGGCLSVMYVVWGQKVYYPTLTRPTV